MSTHQAAPFAARIEREVNEMAKQFTVDSWYDRHARWWYVGVRNADGNLVELDDSGTTALDGAKINLAALKAQAKAIAERMEYDADVIATGFNEALEVEEEQALAFEEDQDVETLAAAEHAQEAMLNTDGQAWFVGSYKGATYRAVQLEDGAFAVPSLSIEDEEVDATLTGERFKSLSNAGHAVAAFVLARLGLENKTPPARATFKLVSGTVAERVKATSTKGSKARALRIFKRSPVNHVAAGQSRWFCSACMASFVVEGDDEPSSCPQGHTAADFAAKGEA